MHDVDFPLLAQSKTAFVKHFQHRGIFRQYLCQQSIEPGATCNLGQMLQQRRTDALPLVLVNDDEGELGEPRLRDDVATAADDHLLAFFFAHRDQSYMVDEVDIQKKFDLLLRELTLWHEEAARQGLSAGAVYRRQHIGPIIRPKGANFDATPIAQGLDGAIVGCL